MKTKIEAANKIITMTRANYKRPVVMSSFGKDSMALLGLIRAAGLKFPVIFHREPFFPEKYEFANRVIKDWDLEVYDYPPSQTALMKRNGQMEVVNFYAFGGGPNWQQHMTALPTGIVDPDYEKCGQRFLCGLKDLLLKPLGNFIYPWDAVLLGHKSTDVDPLRGPMPLHVDIKQTPDSPDALFPLRTWSDADVWEYAEQEQLPIHTDRYQKNGAWHERADKSLNPDYFPVCMRCIDRDQPTEVICPKTGLQINNVSAQVRYIDEREVDYCGEKEQLPA